LDIGGKSGDPIYAAHDGRVIRAGWNGAYGNEVALQHSSGLVTSYHHLTTDYVTVGQGVTAGATIGAMGSTGNSTGPHLHFEVRIKNEPVDPMPYLNGAGTVPISTGDTPVTETVTGGWSSLTAIAEWAADTKNWYRIGLVLAGVVLITIALLGVAKTSAMAKSVTQTVAKTAKGG
jgi:hypothetical protein